MAVVATKKKVSAKSKKFDQMYVSYAEIKKAKLTGHIKNNIKVLSSDFEDMMLNAGGNKFLARLVKTAKRKKMLPLVYAIKFLVK